MSISYVSPMSISYVGPMSISYVGPMSIPYVGPMSFSYVGPISYSYQPATTLPQDQEVTSAPSSRKTWTAPEATPKPATHTATTTSPHIASKYPIVGSPIQLGTPITTTDDIKPCIPQDISESHFTDIVLSWEVDTVTPSINFIEELSQLLLIAVADHFSICLPSYKSDHGKSLTKQIYDKANHEIISLNVTSATIDTRELCTAEIQGATCHIAHVSLQVYSNTSEISQQESIMIVDFLQMLIDTDSILDNSVEILDIREHQKGAPAGLQPLASENVRSGPPDDEKRSRGSKTAVIAVLSVLTVSAMIVLMAAIHSRFMPDLAALDDFPLSGSGVAHSTADPTLA